MSRLLKGLRASNLLSTLYKKQRLAAESSSIQTSKTLAWARHTATAAAEQATSEEKGLELTPNAIEKLRELLGSDTGQHLRLTVEAGGCSGFSYKFDVDGSSQEGDKVVEAEGVRLVTDRMSFEFVKGSKVDYSQELIKSSFEVIDNPNAERGCGCGSSFAPK